MQNNIIDTVTVGKTTANIYQDQDDRGPDEWGDDNLFLVAFHRDLSVSRDGFSQGMCQSIANKGRYEDDSINYDAREIMRKYHVFGLEAYIHGGVVLALSQEGNFPDRHWDVSQLGLVFVAKSEARTRAQARKLALGLIETWNQSLSGDVYGYDIPEGDSCWGFYGMEAVKEAATEAAQYAEDKRIADHIARKKIEITKHVPLSKRTALA